MNLLHIHDDYGSQGLEFCLSSFLLGYIIQSKFVFCFELVVFFML